MADAGLPRREAPAERAAAVAASDTDTWLGSWLSRVCSGKPSWGAEGKAAVLLGDG